MFDVDTPHPMFNAISSARGVLVQYVSTTLATLDDGTLEMECDGLWRASPGFVENLIIGKWGTINWFNDVLRGIELERCKCAAPAAITDPTHQWSGNRAGDVITLADRAIAIMGFRNDEFRSAVQTALCTAMTTPGNSAAKAECEAHAVRQIDEQLGAASTRFRLFLGARSLVPFPPFVGGSDKTTPMQTQAKVVRQLVTSIGRVVPSTLQLGGGARADGGAAAGGDDDDDDGDDDDVGGGGSNSKAAKKQRHRLQQRANRQRAREGSPRSTHRRFFSSRPRALMSTARARACRPARLHPPISLLVVAPCLSFHVVSCAASWPKPQPRWVSHRRCHHARVTAARHRARHLDRRFRQCWRCHHRLRGSREVCLSLG